MFDGRARTGIVGALALAAVLGACDDEDSPTDIDDGPEEGTFQVSVTGDLDEAFDGDAVFAEGTVDGVDVFVISLREDPADLDSGRIWLVLRSDAMPSEGTFDLTGGDHFALDPGEWFAAYREDSAEVDDALVFTKERLQGSVTLETVTQGDVTGTFDFEAEGRLAGATDALLDLSGAFDADPGSIQELPSD